MTNDSQKQDYRKASTQELIKYCGWQIEKMASFLRAEKSRDLSDETRERFASFARTSLHTITYLENERDLTNEEESILERFKGFYFDLLDLESGQILGLSETVSLALKIRGFKNLDVERKDEGAILFMKSEGLEALGYNMDQFSKDVPFFYISVIYDKVIDIEVLFTFEDINKYEYYICKVINDINDKHSGQLGSYVYSPQKRWCCYGYTMLTGASKYRLIDQIMEITFRLIDEFFFDNAKDYQRIKSASLGIIDKEEEYKILKNLSQIVHDHDNR